MTNIYYFDTTADAYDACQCNDSIKDGDILIIESEQVVGIANTWPYAITPNNGSLHRISDGYTAKDLAIMGGYPDNSVEAQHIANELFPVEEIEETMSE